MKTKQKKIFLVEAGVGECMPVDTFIVRETTLKKADKIARSIIKRYYPENWKYNKNDYSIDEVSHDQLVERLTVTWNE